MPSRDEIFEKVKETLVDALGLDDDEVTPSARLKADLGAESIDFLDIVFRLEKGFGIKISTAELSADDIRQRLTAVVLSANDPVAAWGGVKLLRERFGIEPAAVTGPSTDNQVGVDIIQQQMNVTAINAITAGADLGDHLIALVGLADKFPVKAS